MNSHKQTEDKQRLLDLLVDGELSDGERRELLAWCEREPDGWRRCALAFLEAQDWSSVLGALTDTSQESAAPTGPGRSATSERLPPDETGPMTAHGRAEQRGRTSTGPGPFWNVRQWGTMLAMAASVVLAFTLGLWVRDAGKAGQIAPLGSPAVNVVTNGPGSRGEEGGLQMADGDDGGWEPVRAEAVPEDVRQALERMGHHVEQQRRLVPYRLDDGRRVVIPVDQVEVRPVEIRSYQ
ncbi:MAG TPA: hypothetical protein VG826_22520 [Pirellulales bacterium]|nr:hypothetical protein [Pirellulales bacterium]